MHIEFDPPRELSHAIKCLWYDRKEFDPQGDIFRVMPDGFAEIIFYFGELSYMDSDQNSQALTSPFMVGLLNQPAYFKTAGQLEILSIRCLPWEVFNLLGLPARKDSLRMFVQPLSNLQPVLEMLIKAGETEQAVIQIKDFLLAQHNNVKDDTLTKAGKAISNTGGAISVSDIAGAAHATVRTLERKFKRSSGYTVKDVAGLTRFEQVRNRLWHEPDTSLTALAHELSYTDQSHLTREFKRYAGTTPAAFARKAIKDKASIKDDFVAFIQA